MSEVDRPAGHGDIEVHTTEHERPEDWGWHADLGKLARLGGWISVVALLILLTASHYNHSGTGALLIVTALMIGGLLWDRHQRKTSWRQ